MPTGRAATDQSAGGLFAELGVEFFNDASLGHEIAFKVDSAFRMKLGADAHLRPTVRRDKFAAAAKAVRRFQKHVRELDAITIADALGRVAPEPVAAPHDGTSHEAWSASVIAAAVPSRAPALLREFSDCMVTLDRLAVGFDALAAHTRPDRRGADEVPDSLMFGLEGLEALWRQHREDQPAIMGIKRGGFGDLALRALGASGSPFSSVGIRTALRRLNERRTDRR